MFPSSTERLETQDLGDAEEEDDAISFCIGNFGRWQLRHTFFLSLFAFHFTFNMFSSTFSAAPRDFWCSKPDLLTSLTNEQWKNYSKSHDVCQIIDVDWSSTDPLSLDKKRDNITYVPCTHWTWEDTPVTSTIISDWNLVCDKEGLQTLSDLMFLIGIGIGGVVCGFIADRYGRKPTLIISEFCLIVIGIVMPFCKYIELYLVLRLLLGVAVVAVFASGFVLAVELVGGKWKTITGICNFLPMPLSYILVAGISYLLPDWRLYQLAIAVIGIPLLLLWWFLPESPRWLLSMGRTEALKKLIKIAAAENKRPVPENLDKILLSHENTDNRVSVSDLFKGKMLRTTTLCFITWFILTMTYYGLVFNISVLGGNLHITSIISGAVEIPAILISIPIFLKYGKRWPICLFTILSGVSYIAYILYDDDTKPQVKLTLVMIGKFAAGIMNAVYPMFTAELFPTLLRNLGLGIGQVAAGFSLVCIPYLFEQAKYSDKIPLGVIGGITIIGGLCILLLPEVREKPLDNGTQKESNRNNPQKHTGKTRF